MSAVAIRFGTWEHSVRVTPSGKLIVTAEHKGSKSHVAIKENELSAYLWLGDHSLPARQIRRLLDAALRNTGPFADPKHPRRV